MTPSQNLRVEIPEGWQLRILSKKIKHIYFRADLNKKEIRVSAPKGISPRDLEQAIQSKSAWMAKLALEPTMGPLVPQRLEDQDEFSFKGSPCRVRIHSHPRVTDLDYDSKTGVRIQVMPEHDDPGVCAAILRYWLRESLDREMTDLAAHWAQRMGVEPRELKIRKMKTRWGSCNTKAKRIWINEALICLAPELLEYVMIHELAHLIEPGHNARFYGVMDTYLPDWKTRKNILKTFAPGLS